MRFRRIFLIVLDSLGVGAMEEGSTTEKLEYVDREANTLQHVIKFNYTKIKHLQELGLYHLAGIETDIKPVTYYAKAKVSNIGKDSIAGHYEMIGIHTNTSSIKFTKTGFPPELIAEIERISGRKVIGNVTGNGTNLINQFGDEHLATGALIVYTTGDSVLQVAAHEDIMSYEALFTLCGKIRELTLKPEWKVERVIARPFFGKTKSYEMSNKRKDFALNPPSTSLLVYLKESGYETICVGKVGDMLNGIGVTRSIKTEGNTDGIFRILSLQKKEFIGLCIANLNDFDSLYGHRRNIRGYADCLREFDDNVPYFLKYCEDEDLLIFTSDHGCDPTMEGTDHTKEYVPVILYTKYLNQPRELPVMTTLADICATIAENFDVNHNSNGKSFLDLFK